MKRVRMLVSRHYQDVGRERPLDRGLEYELPIVVADALIATGAAVEVLVTRDAKTEDSTGPSKATRAPETKPQRAPETKSLRVAS
jgi:hypothetical protein